MTTTQKPGIKLKYRLDYTDDMPGGDRGYDVLRFGHIIGAVETDWAPGAVEGGPSVRAWVFRAIDGRLGEGHTRDAAVKAGLAKEKTQK